MDAAALFRAGKRVYEVAAELGVAYTTAHGWKTRLAQGGLAALLEPRQARAGQTTEPRAVGRLGRVAVGRGPSRGLRAGLVDLGPRADPHRPTLRPPVQ